MTDLPPRVKDIRGQKFGMLTVLDYIPDYNNNSTRKRSYWKCQCDCGNIKIMLKENIMRRQGSCGCIAQNRMRAPSDLTGMKFNYLTVLEKDTRPQIGKKRSYWWCQCDCGNVISVLRDSLISNKQKSCGCINGSNLIGQKFGKLLVLKDTGKRKFENKLWECQCECGNLIEVRTHDLTSGSTQSCGCIHSRGEEKIKKILRENNIPYEQQKSFDSCIFPLTKSKLFFDFYINNDFLLEYDGIQHYHYTNSGWDTEDAFILRKKRDEYKNNWCKENNIHLKRIPYTDYDIISIESIMNDTYLLKGEK